METQQIKKKTAHIVFDLETLGKGFNSKIIQVGSSAFDDHSPFISGFDSLIDPEKYGAYDSKFSIEMDTIIWWSQQTPNLLTRLSQDEHDSPYTVFNLWRIWVEKIKEKYEKVILWSHSNFDPPKLKHHLDVFGLKDPIYYRNICDLRTIFNLYGYPPKHGVGGNQNKHDAFADAKYCANQLIYIFNKNNLWEKLNRKM